MDLREFSERKRDLDYDVSLWNPLFLQMYFAINEVRNYFTKLPDADRLKIYDFGCGTKPYEVFCQNKDYIGIDIDKKNKQADIFSSIDRVPVDDETADIVVSFYVLEHVPNPFDVIKEKHRILKTGGELFMLVPLYWEEHEQPYDYYRFTRYAIDSMLKEIGFKNIRIAAINSGYSILGMNLARLFLRKWLRPLVPAVNFIFMKLEERSQRINNARGISPSNVMTFSVRAEK